MSETNRLKSFLTLIFLSAIWGTSFILIKKSLTVYAPEEVAILRIGISGLAFTPFFIKYFKDHEWKRWPLYVLVALTGSAIPAFLFATAQTEIGSATVGILNSITPIFALLIGIVFFKSPTNRKQMLGVFIGFLGTAVLIAIDASADDLTGQLLYGSLIVVASILYGANVNIVKEWFAGITPLKMSTLAFFLVGMPFLFIIPFTDIPAKTLSDPYAPYALGYMTILAVVSTMWALYIFYQLVQDTSAIFASSVAYLIPIVALMWGVFDGESIGILHLLCLAVIVSGVYLVRID